MTEKSIAIRRPLCKAPRDPRSCLRPEKPLGEGGAGFRVGPHAQAQLDPSGKKGAPSSASDTVGGGAAAYAVLRVALQTALSARLAAKSARLSPGIVLALAGGSFRPEAHAAGDPGPAPLSRAQRALRQPPAGGRLGRGGGGATCPHGVRRRPLGYRGSWSQLCLWCGGAA